jgi:hypothetical protein
MKTERGGQETKQELNLQKMISLIDAERHNSPVPEFVDPRFRENKPKTLVFGHRK